MAKLGQPIRTVAVLGAGVMGAQIAAHLLNAHLQVLLFDLPGPHAPAELVQQAVARLRKLQPAPCSLPSKLEALETLNFRDDLAQLQRCDLVIEAIAERVDLKQALYAQVAPHLAAHAVLATNTSGLSLAHLAAGLPEDLRPRFCGVHFFNPPRYMPLVELIATPSTASALLDDLETFLTVRLGKSVVRAKDTPNFIANRIGVYSLLVTMHHAQRLGVALDVVDGLTGSLLGRAKSATFRTVDVVGLDIMNHAVKTMADTLPNDPWHRYFQIPAWIQGLIDAGHLGQKTKSGIYQKQGDAIWVWDLATQAYRPSGKNPADAVKAMLKQATWAERLAACRQSDHPQAQLVWCCFRDLFHYLAVHAADIADNVRDIDLALRWGYGWEQGPFEIWQQAGWSSVLEAIEQARLAGETLVDTAMPDWVWRLQAPVHQPTGSFNAQTGTWDAPRALPVYRRQLQPPSLAGVPPVVWPVLWHSPELELRDLGDDVHGLVFKTKMHTVSEAVLTGLLQTLERTARAARGLVIAQDHEPFSAGADLNSMTPAFMAGNFAEIERVIALFQQTSQALKYAAVPVVAGVRGLALGGGCELLMHCPRVVAAMESYIGLVEVGVGLLPAGGGCKEFAWRAAQEAGSGAILPRMQAWFEQIAKAKVATSADEAMAMGYLKASDVVVMHPMEVLHVAKQQVWAMSEAGYRPPLPAQPFPVLGQTGAATLGAMILNLERGGWITEHDATLARKIAHVMSGGAVAAGTLVTEQYLLDLERAAFLELLQHPKTQARIGHMLMQGKPLRN